VQIIFLEKLIFVKNNWPHDLRIGYKSPFDLLEFFERDMDLEKEFEELEGEFERDGVAKV
jgi:hypothetical protein